MQKLSRGLMLGVALALVLTVLPFAPVVRARSAPYHPLGTGARFMPAGSALYLAVDLNPGSEQTQLLDRLSATYMAAPEVGAAERQLTERLGLSVPIRSVIGEIRPLLGSEIFLGVPTPADLGRLQTFDTAYIRLDCRDPEILVGAAIADLDGLRAYLANQRDNLDARGVRTTVERHGDTDIVRIAGRSPELAVYLSIQNDYLLTSTSRAFLIAALDRDPSRSLAADEGFRIAGVQFPGAPLAFLYSSLPESAFMYGGTGGYQESPTRWFAGALRLAQDAIRVETASSTDPSRLKPAHRALLDKAPNPLRSATVLPANSAFFVGWDNLKLAWDRYVEDTWPDPEAYAESRRAWVAEVGLDPDDDIFGWMTGEIALVAAPAGEAREDFLGRAALGLLIEARDPAAVAPKYERIVQYLRQSMDGDGNGAPPAPVEQEIAGVTFQRLGSESGFHLYITLVDGWVVLTTDAVLAEDIVTAMGGHGSLADQPEFIRAREEVGGPLQFFGYLSVPDAVWISTSSVGASGGFADEEQVAPYVRPIRSVGLGVNTRAVEADSVFSAHIVMPTEMPVFPSDGLGASWDQHRRPGVLLDLTRHGGAWTWGEPTRDRRERIPLDVFLADRLAVPYSRTVQPDGRIGRVPRDERGNAMGERSTWPVEPETVLLVRVGSDGPYGDDELATYRDYVRCGGSLLLLSDGKAPGETDGLAEAFGFHVAGAVQGEALLSTFRQHPATRDVWPLAVPGGTGLLGWDEYTVPLGYLSRESYLDLDGDGQQADGEPSAPAIYAVRPYGRGTVAFLGTTAVLTDPEHPVLGQLLRYLLPRAAWYMPDPAEPDDWPGAARSLPLDGSTQQHSLYPAHDEDWVTFEAAQGQAVILLVSGGCLVDLQVIDGDGITALATRKYIHERAVVSFTAPHAGQYFVRVQDSYGQYHCAAYILAGTVRTVPGAPPVPSGAPPAAVPAPVQVPRR